MPALPVPVDGSDSSLGAIAQMEMDPTAARVIELATVPVTVAQ